MIYVTSDLHGIHPDLFQAFLNRVGFTEDDYLFILGDVVDRGEYGAELLLWLTEQTNMSLILGNHEAFLLSCSYLFEKVTEKSLSELDLGRITTMQQWVANGGNPTMNGFRRLLRRDPELVTGILDYLRDAPFYEALEVNGRRFVLVHAGLGNFDPNRPLSDYTVDELIWERPDLEDQYFSDATVIFGHTPTQFFGEEYMGRMFVRDSWICIDTGAACGGMPMLLRLDDMKEFYMDS